jgi:hypothetical protein
MFFVIFALRGSLNNTTHSSSQLRRNEMMREPSSLGWTVRRERENKSRLFSIGAYRVFLCFVLFVHCFTTVHERGSVELYTRWICIR